MPSRRVCSFCGGDIEPGTGKMFVKKDGAIFYFCSPKCEKNQLDLHRVPRRIKWTKRYVKPTKAVEKTTKAAAKPTKTVAKPTKPAENPK